MNKYLYLILGILWAGSLWLSTRLGLGELFCILSGLLLIFCNLGTRKGESAYSVFNEGCKKLPGQFDPSSLIKNQKSSTQEIVKPRYTIKNRRLANKPCPCNSGKKHKKCCLTSKDESFSD